MKGENAMFLTMAIVGLVLYVCLVGDIERAAYSLLADLIGLASLVALIIVSMLMAIFLPVILMVAIFVALLDTPQYEACKYFVFNMTFVPHVMSFLGL